MGRRKPSSKHLVVIDAGGVPLATTLTGANAHDVLKQLAPLVEASGKMIRHPIARSRTEHGSDLGIYRYVVG